MLLRIVSGGIPPALVTASRDLLRRDYIAAAEPLAGLERYLVGTRPASSTAADLDIAFMTLWTDVESASAAYGGRLTALRLLGSVDHGEVLDRVDYYEVEIAEARRHPGVPRHLRLTAGTVSRGLDADIQRDLRQRLGELPPEVVDAYIGRRVKGQSVEIAFVSTWTEDVSLARLEEPVWPDISAQYETFWIRVYDVLLEGAPGG